MPLPLSAFPIGLTGGMGSGKSTVSQMLAAMGMVIVDADKITRQVYQNPRIIAQLTGEFGHDIYDQSGQIPQVVRPLLARRAFASDDKRRRLNEIMHPAMRDTAEAMLKSAQKLAILDAPLLFEAGWDNLVHTTTAVICPLETRIRRIRQRDGLDDAQMMARIRSQIDNYETRADILIYNTGDFHALQTQIIRIFGGEYTR